MSMKLTEAENAVGPLAKMEKAYEIFAFLHSHPTLLDYPKLLTTVDNKIRDILPQIENEKKHAIDMFVSLFHKNLHEIEEMFLLRAKSTIAIALKLEDIFSKLQPIVASKLK